MVGERDFDTVKEAFESSLESLEDFFFDTLDTLPDLNHIHSQAQDAFNRAIEGLTQGGSLTITKRRPDLERYTITQSSKSNVATPGLLTNLYRHPFMSTGLVFSVATTLLLAISPCARKALHRRLSPIYTQSPTRPLTVPGNNNRVELVLVLGADPGSLGEKIALDFVQKGWAVLATVKHPKDLEALEKVGKGYLKPLVLDPEQPSSVAPFGNSLDSALSMRFPLHCGPTFLGSGEPGGFLTAIINCLAMDGTRSDPYPFESLSMESLTSSLARLNSLVLTIKTAIPALRRRPRISQGSHVPRRLLTVLPSIRSQNLPFASVESAMYQAVMSFLSSLRRELAGITDIQGFRIELPVLLVGISRPLGLPLDIREANGLVHIRQLNPRLQQLYAPALLRAGPVEEPRHTLSQELEVVAKVHNIAVRGSIFNVSTVHARLHHLTSQLPAWVVDTCLTLRDYLTKTSLGMDSDTQILTQHHTRESNHHSPPSTEDPALGSFIEIPRAETCYP